MAVRIPRVRCCRKPIAGRAKVLVSRSTNDRSLVWVRYDLCESHIDHFARLTAAGRHLPVSVNTTGESVAC